MSSHVWPGYMYRQRSRACVRAPTAQARSCIPGDLLHLLVALADDALLTPIGELLLVVLAIGVGIIGGIGVDQHDELRVANPPAIFRGRAPFHAAGKQRTDVRIPRATRK